LARDSSLAGVASRRWCVRAQTRGLGDGGTFDGRFGDRDHAVEVFVRHNEEVKRRVPPEKLLVFEVKEGWGPLCEFLGVEAPDGPFPHLNDRDQFPKMMRRQMATALAPAIGKTIVAASMLFAALWLLRLISTRRTVRD
jgi:hypothetical protein